MRSPKRLRSGSLQATVDAFGGLDVLINNAGVIDSGPIEQFGEAQWDRIFAVNVKGVFLMTRAGGGESEGIRGRRHRQHGVHRRHRPIDTVPGSGLAARLSAQGRAPLRVSEAPAYAVRRVRFRPRSRPPIDKQGCRGDGSGSSMGGEREMRISG